MIFMLILTYNLYELIQVHIVYMGYDNVFSRDMNCHKFKRRTICLYNGFSYKIK